MKTDADCPAADVREEAEKAGYRDGCRACIRAVAFGGEACGRHYVPWQDRRPRDAGPDGGRAA